MGKTSHVRALMTARPNDWLDHLTSEYKIKATRDGDLVSLEYDMNESPMGEPIVQECRGMVVCTRSRRVLAWPYDKFWNHGEAMAAEIDWATAEVLEKLDGSLMILYYDPPDEADSGPGCWRVVSSGTPLASGSYNGECRTFAQVFWVVAQEIGINLIQADKQLTYMFELCDAANRIVVRYDRPRLVLHGARDTESGGELDRQALGLEAAALGVELVRGFPIDSIDACIAAAAELDPLTQEGFVVVDGARNRVKIKSPRYVALHLMKGSMTERRAVELWVTGESGELLSAFPEFTTDVRAVHDRIDAVAAAAVRDFAANAAAPDRKTFALAVKALPYSAVLFRMASEVESGAADALSGGDVALDAARRIMRGMTIAALERMIASL